MNSLVATGLPHTGSLVAVLSLAASPLLARGVGLVRLLHISLIGREASLLVLVGVMDALHPRHKPLLAHARSCEPHVFGSEDEGSWE